MVALLRRPEEVVDEIGPELVGGLAVAAGGGNVDDLAEPPSEAVGHVGAVAGTGRRGHLRVVPPAH